MKTLITFLTIIKTQIKPKIISTQGHKEIQVKEENEEADTLDKMVAALISGNQI